MGFCLGWYELWPRCRGVLLTVRDVASLSGITCAGINRASLSGSACYGTGNGPSKSEPKWLLRFYLRATELVLIL